MPGTGGSSNSVLDKDEATAKWYSAAGEQSPITANVDVGYGGHIDSDVRLAPIKLNEVDGNSVDFSGMQVLLSGEWQRPEFNQAHAVT